MADSCTITTTNIHDPTLQPKPRISVSSHSFLLNTGTDFMIDNDDHTSGTVVSSTTNTTSSSSSGMHNHHHHCDNNSSSSSSTITSNAQIVAEDTASTLSLPRSNRRILSSRLLVVLPNVIQYLRSQEIQTIVQWYYQQQQRLRSSQIRNSINGDKNNSIVAADDDFLLHPNFPVPTRSLLRDSIGGSSTCSVTSHHETSTTSSPTFLIVSGPTGSGKTRLLQDSLQELMSSHNNGGFYIRGSFDVQQHPDPYRVFKLLWTDFATQVLVRSKQTPSLVVTLRQVILEACGDEIQVLTQMIPPLSAIIDPTILKPNEKTDMSQQFESVRSVSITSAAIDKHPPVSAEGDVTQRFLFVLQKFLHAICTVIPTIVLVLEDMQYADDCSIDVLCSILTDLHLMPSLMVVATYNGTDLMDYSDTSTEASGRSTYDPSCAANSVETTYFVKHIRKIERCCHSNGSIQVQTVSTENFNDEQVLHILSHTLQQCAYFNIQVDDTFHALVMKHTSGNLYCIIEFLSWLENRQLLVPQIPTLSNSTVNYWTWNIDDINRAVKDHLLPTNKNQSSNPHALYINNMLERVPPNVIEVLKVAACLGSSHMDEKLIQYVFDFPVHSLLSEAVDLGIIVPLHKSKEGKQYTFVHETVQTLIYHLIPKNDRDLFHLEAGRRLWRHFDHDDLERNIFVVLAHMRIGKRLIHRQLERYKVAALCLHAGRKAAKVSSFRVSLLYLKWGIELLGARGWRDEYDLTLMLYNATAEMEVCRSNYEGMECLVGEILQNGRCADDTIQARRTQLYALCINDRQHEGLDRGIQLLADLGFSFPAHFSLWTLRSEVKAVLSLLKGKSNDYIKRLPIIDDSNVLAAMHVLNVLYIHAALVRPRFAAFVALKMMKLTLKYGLTFMAPLAFVTFGMLCIKIFPTTDAAFRYGELGLELLDKFQLREYLPRAYAAYYACIFPWKHRIPESLEYLLLGARVGILTGDIEAACLCVNLWVYIASMTDIPLDEIEMHFLTFQTTVKSRRVKLSQQMACSCLQSIQYLQGKDVDFSETEHMLRYSVDNQSVMKTATIRWWQARMALLFNDLPRADDIAYEVNFSKNKHTTPPNSQLVETACLNGLIALQMASQPKMRHGTVRPQRSRRHYIAEGKRMIRFIKKYVSWAPSNYYDKQVLHEAELAAVEGRKDQVLSQYICAISLSKVSRNILIQGLANERAGRYCLSALNQPMEALKYFDAALMVYGEWKAYRKVEHLRMEMKMMFGSHEDG